MNPAKARRTAQDAVQLMTLHSAKVWSSRRSLSSGWKRACSGMMSMEESGRLEEERRLAYVGVTRAMQKLDTDLC
ncbi:3'-5' exonuclease [Shigella flexneri]